MIIKFKIFILLLISLSFSQSVDVEFEMVQLSHIGADRAAGILKALGIQNISLRKIFIYHGGLLLSIGFIIGNLISIILIWIQNEM